MDKKLTSTSFSLFSKVNYAWRVLATAIGFILFGLGGITLSLIIFPLITLCVHDKQKCHALAQNIIQKSFRIFIGTLSFLNALSYRFENMDVLNNDQGTIIVANHPSLLDVVFIASCMPRCDCIVKQALFNNFFLKGVLKTAGYIPNTEPESLLNACQQKLQQSGMLLIFPEGTRTKPEQPITLQRGVANIALRTQSDIRLLSICCNYPILTKQQKWYQSSPQKPEFVITAHQKLNIHDFIHHNDTLTIDARHLTDFLQQQLNNNIEQIKLNGEYAHEFKTRTKTAHH